MGILPGKPRLGRKHTAIPLAFDIFLLRFPAISFYRPRVTRHLWVNAGVRAPPGPGAPPDRAEPQGPMTPPIDP